jgi:hypothetical protein
MQKVYQKASELCDIMKWGALDLSTLELSTFDADKGTRFSNFGDVPQSFSQSFDHPYQDRPSFTVAETASRSPLPGSAYVSHSQKTDIEKYRLPPIRAQPKVKPITKDMFKARHALLRMPIQLGTLGVDKEDQAYVGKVRFRSTVLLPLHPL